MHSSNAFVVAKIFFRRVRIMVKFWAILDLFLECVFKYFKEFSFVESIASAKNWNISLYEKLLKFFIEERCSTY